MCDKCNCGDSESENEVLFGQNRDNIYCGGSDFEIFNIYKYVDIIQAVILDQK